MIEIRPLNAEDAASLREVRLRALREEGEYFTASLEEESAMTLAEWRAVAQETTDQVVIGGFIDGKLVGIMGGKKWERDDEGTTIYWWSLYVMPEFRHLGLGRKIYGALDNWSFAQGFEQSVFTIHHQNTYSIDFNIKQSAQPFDKEPKRFADGSTAPAIWYRKCLQVAGLIAA